MDRKEVIAAELARFKSRCAPGRFSEYQYHIIETMLSDLYERGHIKRN